MTARAAAIVAGATLLWGCDSGRNGPDPAPPPDGRIYPEHDARAGVDCRGTQCALGSACCYEVSHIGPKPTRITYCALAEGCPETTFLCDGPEDCGDGELCCAITPEVWTCAPESECITAPACHAEIHCGAFSACCPTPSQVIKVCLSGGCGRT